MMYVETEKTIGRGFVKELRAAGVPVDSYAITTRRVDPSGSCIMDRGGPRRFPRAIMLRGRATEKDRARIQSVVDSHSPNFGWVDRRVAEVKAEAHRRITNRLPEWKQAKYMARSIEIMRMGDSAGYAEREEMAHIDSEMSWLKSVTDASDRIEALIEHMTDEEAGRVDASEHPEWP